MKNLVKQFLKNQSGATAIEYGLIAAGLAIAVIAGVNLLAPSLSGSFDSLGTTVTNASTTAVNSNFD